MYLIYKMYKMCNSMYFFLGGQETTAFANACIIFMLAHHEDVQNQVIYIFYAYYNMKKSCVNKLFYEEG